ncbi:MAG: hypothetical protein ABI637_04215 [Gemmatimonadota bacterium]
MRSYRSIVLANAALALTLATACTGGDRQNAAAADSAGRDLQLAPSDSSAALNDRAAGESPAASTSSRAGTSPASGGNASTATSRSGASLSAGTVVTARLDHQISSATNKAGETVRATVGTAVRDGSGRVVIPAGSVVTLSIVKLHESENKSDNNGTLVLDVSSVEIGGRSYPLSGTVHATTSLVGRKTNVNDVAKVGAGAGIGAVAGRVLGGSKGTVIGGVLGGAVGAQRAVETKDRDVVAAANSTVRITLDSGFIASR